MHNDLNQLSNLNNNRTLLCWQVWFLRPRLLYHNIQTAARAFCQYSTDTFLRRTCNVVLFFAGVRENEFHQELPGKELGG